MTLKKKLDNFYQRNKPQVRTSFYLVLFLTVAMKIADIGFGALENYMNSEEYRTKSWEKALENPEFRLEVHEMYREHYGQPYEGFQTGTGR